MRKIAVIGGGPAGLAAAVTAFHEGADVTVVEKGKESGRTILRTGNGRCNFSNLNIDIDKYYNADFVRQATLAWDFNTCAFLEHYGLIWVANEQGMCFPLSNRAESVLWVLRDHFDFSEMHEVTNTDTFDTSGFDAVVYAMGNTWPGAKFTPVLCPIEVLEKDELKYLDGCRVKCGVKVVRSGEVIFEEAGEVQFRKYGLSGIVIFNASRYAQPGDKIQLDFTHFVQNWSKAMFEDRVENFGSDLHYFFSGFVSEDIGYLIFHRLSSLDDDDELYNTLTKFEFTVDKLHDDPKTVQVMRGGIPVDEIDPVRMHWKDNIYVAGEMVDVDGPCGGYNLDWAFRSGYIAGYSAAHNM